MDFQAGWLGGPLPRYELSADILLRGIALIYLVAFVVAANQAVALVGEQGILPAQWYLDDWWNAQGAHALWKNATLFWLSTSDWVLHAAAWVGIALSMVVLVGRGTSWMFGILWLLQLSFMHVGQVFWGYGWELLLAEAGVLAMFLAPWRVGEAAPFATPVVVLFRWLAFRLMFGAGLIKVRGDECWTELTCLDFHYETQPVPSPLSFLFAASPTWLHRFGVAFNHFVELIVPFGVFGPKRLRYAAGVLLVVFQLTLIASGNLSFLNWLTLVVCLSCFDDDAFERVLTIRGRFRWRRPGSAERSKVRTVAVWSLVVVVVLLSVSPVVNLLSNRQAMNASFDPIHLVNTYGAFGSVTKERYEVVLEGTMDPDLESATWREYELPCKPGDPERRPCLITPYHYRLDWQMWFAALSDYEHQVWIVRVVYLLLRGNQRVRELLAHDPFEGRAPRYVRARLFRYRMRTLGDDGWWEREAHSEYLRPVSLDDPELLAFLGRMRWLR